MKKIKAFNFVELMMVMLILGIIISLTMPLVKNIKDDDGIYRSYMKKANQEVIDAFTMGMMRNPSVRDMSSLALIAGADNSHKLRNLFNDAINGLPCGKTFDKDYYDEHKDDADYVEKWDEDDANVSCTKNRLSTQFPDINLANAPFIVLGGKSVMVFKDETAAAKIAAGIYGYVYVDMNGNKSPNEMCKDRYRFIIYRNSVAMDTEATVGGAPNPYACSFNL